jgi:putative transposase
MLNERINVYQKFKDNKKKLNTYKYKTEKEYKNEFNWLNEVDSIALQSSKEDLNRAYSNFFRRVKKGEHQKGFPLYHKKGRKNSYRSKKVINNIQIDFKNHKIKLPKMSPIHFHDTRVIENIDIVNVTVIMTPIKKYFVSIIYKDYNQPQELLDIKSKELKVKGIDCSFSKFFVDETGDSPKYSRFFRENEDNLALAMQKVSRRKKGSNRRKKAQLKVNRIHEKIVNLRKDFLEKLSNKLVKENDVIVIEDLNMKNLSQAFHFGKSVYDLGWGTFIIKLKEKAKKHSKIIKIVDKWFASSKTCSNCNYVKKDLTLSDQEWACPKCGTLHNRDHNAARNLVNNFSKGLQKVIL